MGGKKSAVKQQELPHVCLRPLEERDYALFDKWMRIPDVYAFLELPEPVGAAHIKVAVLAKRTEVLMIELDEGDPIGFFFVYFSGYVRTNTREFDIAVPDPRARQQGVAKAAIRAFEAWALDEQKLSGVWAAIFSDNQACLELVRSCGWPLSEVTDEGALYLGEPKAVVYTHMNPEIRAGLEERRGF